MSNGIIGGTFQQVGRYQGPGSVNAGNRELIRRTQQNVNNMGGGGGYQSHGGMGRFDTSKDLGAIDEMSMFRMPKPTNIRHIDLANARNFARQNRMARFFNTMRANYMGGLRAKQQLGAAQRAAMAGLNYDLKLGSRGDFQNLNRAGMGGYMGAGTGVTSGGSAGFSPEMATMGQSRRARELTGLQERFGLQRSGIDERTWGRQANLLASASNQVVEPNYGGYRSRYGGGGGGNIGNAFGGVINRANRGLGNWG